VAREKPREVFSFLKILTKCQARVADCSRTEAGN
jgi:hypothetical protein